MPAKKPKPKRPGRRAMDPAARARPLNTTLPPAVWEWLAEVGGGSASSGLRTVAVRAHAEKVAAESAEKQA